MRRRGGYNPKRRICRVGSYSQQQLDGLSKKASYTGNPQHKMRPGSYGLTPLTGPRPGKTLCDAVADFPKSLAEDLLRNGFINGLLSSQGRNGWPQNVWSVHEGKPYEAQPENVTTGTYHGYPMPDDDDFRKTVLEEWRAREPKT